MNIPYFSFYPQDWLSEPKVQQLTYEEQGIYFALLCHMWNFANEYGDPSLPNDDKFIQRLLKIRPAKWKKVKAVLVEGIAPVIEVRDGRLVNKRLLKEFKKAKEKSDKAAKAAKKRWKESSSEHENGQKNGGIVSTPATKKQGDKTPKTPPLKESNSADALQTQCHTDTEPESDKENNSCCSNEQQQPGGCDRPEPTNQALIAELTEEYREVIPKRLHQNGDYAFMGALYNQYGYDAVYTAIDELSFKIKGGFVPQKPLAYLKGMLQKSIRSPSKGGTANGKPRAGPAGKAGRDDPDDRELVIR